MGFAFLTWLKRFPSCRNPKCMSRALRGRRCSATSLRVDSSPFPSNPLSYHVCGTALIVLSAALSHAQSVLLADKYTGADAGEKITKCIAALPPTGGVCDARNLAGEQASASGFTVGSPSKPVELMLGPVMLLTRGTIHVSAKSSI